MNLTTEVELLGGPSDGMHLEIPLGQMGPTPTITVATGELSFEGGEPRIRVVNHVYIRVLSPNDDGPLWHYVYINPEGES